MSACDIIKLANNMLLCFTVVMNLMLFTENETHGNLPRHDERAKHLTKVLRVKIGDRIRAGIINGNTGQALIKDAGSKGYRLEFEFDTPPAALEPLTMIIGMARPIAAKRIILDLASMAVERIIFTATTLGEKSYLSSNLWKDENVRRYLIAGCMQGGHSLLPRLDIFSKLEDAIHTLPDTSSKFVFCNTKGVRSSKVITDSDPPFVCAIGTERGWTKNEIDLFTSGDFIPVSLGRHILKTATASIAAGTLVLSRIYGQ